MEWNLKSPSWDLTQFGHELDSDNNLGGDGGGSSMVDLKLGRVTNSSDESKGKLKELGLASKMTGSSPSGSSKRARAGGNNCSTQMVSCLVDGCVSDLKNCREYHRRHKVCELHSKTPQVTIGGHNQRFCQQCSRFHSLEEFDEGKRSCRKRLDGHNRRRRKPQPEPMLSTNSYLSNYPGTRLFPFSHSSLMASPTWPGPIKTMEEACLYNSNKGMNRFPSMQGENPMFINNNIASSQNGGSSTSSSNHRMFTTRVPDSDCALSLLSSPPPPPPPMQPVVATQQRYNGIEHVDPMILAGNPNLHCHGFFHMDQNDDDESCSYSDAPQTLPFYWD